MNRTSKLDIATELLDCALRFYYEGDCYFAALHLAGAAEEVLAGHIKNKDKTLVPALDSMKLALSDFLGLENGHPKKLTEKRASDILSYAKNSTKHWQGKGDGYVDFDPEAEAKELLDFAITNYYQLMSSYTSLKETELIRRFNAELKSA